MAKAKADRDPAKDEGPKQLKTPGFVRYVGISDARGITQRDFAMVGVDHPSLWWNKENNWRVPLSDISDAAFSVAIESDPELILVEEDQGEEDQAPAEPEEG